LYKGFAASISASASVCNCSFVFAIIYLSLSYYII
jgi:hypothetical protein